MTKDSNHLSRTARSPLAMLVVLPILALNVGACVPSRIIRPDWLDAEQGACWDSAVPFMEPYLGSAGRAFRGQEASFNVTLEGEGGCTVEAGRRHPDSKGGGLEFIRTRRGYFHVIGTK